MPETIETSQTLAGLDAEHYLIEIRVKGYGEWYSACSWVGRSSSLRGTTR